MKINEPGSAHVGPMKNGDAEWLPYDNTIVIQKNLLLTAISMIRVFILGRTTCDKAFKSLPGGRSFSEIFNDNSVWISYCKDPNIYGYTDAVGGKEITICQHAFGKGVGAVTGTLVHEMAHVNGADGSTHAAEATLPPCFMTAVYDPTIVGNRSILPVLMG